MRMRSVLTVHDRDAEQHTHRPGVDQEDVSRDGDLPAEALQD